MRGQVFFGGNDESGGGWNFHGIGLDGFRNFIWSKFGAAKSILQNAIQFFLKHTPQYLLGTLWSLGKMLGVCTTGTRRIKALQQALQKMRHGQRQNA